MIEHLPFRMILRPVKSQYLNQHYQLWWDDDEPAELFSQTKYPEPQLDLVPFSIARELLQRGNHPGRRLIIKLENADQIWFDELLGDAAAKPLVNRASSAVEDFISKELFEACIK